MHRDISTGNTIIVENNGCIRGLLSDFEYAKAMDNESASPDPKTVRFDIKDRIFLTFDQGTPYFMPLEIHRGEKYLPPAYIGPQPTEEFKKRLRSGSSRLPRMPGAILRYTSNHDQESLMWVALWIVYGLVEWEEANSIRPQIFANTRFPTREREYFFRSAGPKEERFYNAFHSKLCDDYPRCFYMMLLELYGFCMLPDPKEEDYHNLLNNLGSAFDELLAKVTGKPGIVSFVVRSGSENQADVEVERPRETGHAMTLRSHVGHSRLRRWY